MKQLDEGDTAVNPAEYEMFFIGNNNLNNEKPQEHNRTLLYCGEVNEIRTAQFIEKLLDMTEDYLKVEAERKKQKDCQEENKKVAKAAKKKKKKEEVELVDCGEGIDNKPIKIFVSTYGGAATEMFGIYDIMRLIKEKGVPLHTYGVGKIMSAGVLLVAAGTKRYLGENTQIMIHTISEGMYGKAPDIKNEVKQLDAVLNMYKKVIKQETGMSDSEITRYVTGHKDNYISAEKAVELGIADEIW